jgi:glucose-6-phosphate isomerase
VTDPSSSLAWSALGELANKLRTVSLSESFREDPLRETRFCIDAEGLTLDYSHQQIDSRVVESWQKFFDECSLTSAIDEMFDGGLINNTESRAALHVALRQAVGDRIGGEAVERAVLAERSRMLDFATEVRDSGRYSTVVNIGIGGSDLGPAMVCRALTEHRESSVPSVVFVSNVDGCAMSDVLRTADPSRTLFVVCSKTFTTQETLANAQTAREWLIERLGVQSIAHHFAGVSMNGAAMSAFGIHPARQFFMWDWVGGRFSTWSSVGLTAAIGIGRAAFEDFLAGARNMDQHFRVTPWPDNLPVMLAALGAWNVDFMGLSGHAVLPYSDRLSLLPTYLQQLEMESNGKSVTRDGAPVAVETCPIVWGTAASNAQHSYFQLLHQGPLRSSLDIVIPIEPPKGAIHHKLALANALGQIEAFTIGRTSNDPHRRHEGGRPLSILLIDRLTPSRLGSLLAMYEHKVFVLSQIWQTNPFDQFGVELGKFLANRFVGALTPGSAAAIDGTESVRYLASRLRKMTIDRS